MMRIKSISLTFALILVSTLFTLAQAQTPRVSTVNITTESDKVRINAQGDVSEMRIEARDEQGTVVFQSGAISGNALDWNMRDTQGERAAPGTYLVTVTFRDAAGKLRKRVEQVTIADDEKASPRNTATPSAVQATITGAGTANRIAKFTGAATIGNSVIVESAGRIGIGTTGPASTLTVVGAIANNPVISSVNNAVGGVGVRGSSNDSAGVGIWGRHSAMTGVTPGVRGETFSTADGAVGVHGVVNTTNPGYQAAAVLGTNKGTGGNAVLSFGVWGDHAGVGSGVYGTSHGGTGVDGSSDVGTGVSGFSPSGTGVSGRSTSGIAVGGSSTSNVGVSGFSSSSYGVYGTSTSSYAGYFQGKAKVTGLLEVGSCTGCTMSSDQNLKTNFSTINPHIVLNRLAALPIRTWNYKNDDSSIRHIGPMAQDFRSAFNLGVDDKHIDMIDANGVTMAAIQGLYQMMQEKNQQNDQLIRTVEQQSRQIEQLQVQLNQVKLSIRRKRLARKR